MKSITTKLLWFVFGALLAVLLPHTAWLFGQFEPDSITGTSAAWAGAFAFEASIAVLVHKLAKHWEATPKRATGWAKLSYRWLNAYVAGLVISAAVSALANLAHAVEFGRELAIFAAWGIPPQMYQVAFGGVLPLVSLLFARVLSNETTTEDTVDPELIELRHQLTEAKKAVRAAEAAAAASERERQAAEQRFDAAGEIIAKLFAPEKRERIQFVSQQWPGLPASSVAILAEASPSYVSEVLNEANK